MVRMRLKDSMDKKNETALKESHEAISLAIRISAMLSNFTGAIVIWEEQPVSEP